MISLVGPEMFHRIAKIWLKVISSDFRILAQDATTIRRIGFPTRTSARKFVSVWCGKLISTG
jgi:hypothetical protein